MPKIVRSDMVGFEAARQLQADSFDASPAKIFSGGIKRAACILLVVMVSCQHRSRGELGVPLKVSTLMRR
ncbi:hypothetical protein [Candidatus Electronema sp. JC]|uniref:hypothetical protein n=1 Tax=Candidatus Electronema sp. JC TaxID=3401570 RepID=UPI003B42FB94